MEEQDGAEPPPRDEGVDLEQSGAVLQVGKSQGPAEARGRGQESGYANKREDQEVKPGL